MGSTDSLHRMVEEALSLDPLRVQAAYAKACDALLAQRTEAGHWVGELSASSLSTATAITALSATSAGRSVSEATKKLIEGGLNWLASHQNPDGGWGDTVKSKSNISTTMLCRAAITICRSSHTNSTLQRCEQWLDIYGQTPAELAEAVRRRYGKDRTFSVPILMMCALAGLVPWKEVPRLPFELACIPQSWYRFARMPVVSYALPALIAIGQVIHAKRFTANPYSLITRWLAKKSSLRVLERIQPRGGGFLEATPLTSFVVMSLASIPNRTPAADRVIERGIDYIVRSAQPDGSWPIDTNLSIWVTTLAVNALAAAGDLESLDRRDELVRWLLDQQTKEMHPYTGAAPGAWGWSDEPGSVPDCDDTPGTILAISNLTSQGGRLSSPLPISRKRVEGERLLHAEANPSSQPRPRSGAGEEKAIALRNGTRWMLALQNRDGGFPTFCRGWGKLPFDRSGTDLTAHALRAIREVDGSVLETGFTYLRSQQRADGSWLPLWFGNQHAQDDINPVYGTSRVLAAYRDLKRAESNEARRGIAFLLDVQNPDGGWGGAEDSPSSVEETALAIEVLLDLVPPESRGAIERGIDYLLGRVHDGTFAEPSPIGFYFAKLWYFEKLYPIIFTVAALGRASRQDREKAY